MPPKKTQRNERRAPKGRSHTDARPTDSISGATAGATNSEGGRVTRSHTRVPVVEIIVPVSRQGPPRPKGKSQKPKPRQVTQVSTSNAEGPLDDYEPITPQRQMEIFTSRDSKSREGAGKESTAREDEVEVQALISGLLSETQSTTPQTDHIPLSHGSNVTATHRTVLSLCPKSAPNAPAALPKFSEVSPDDTEVDELAGDVSEQNDKDHEGISNDVADSTITNTPQNSNNNNNNTQGGSLSEKAKGKQKAVEVLPRREPSAGRENEENEREDGDEGGHEEDGHDHGDGDANGNENHHNEDNDENEDEDEDDDDDDEDEEDTSGSGLKPGRLSKAALEEIAGLRDMCRAEAERLATKYSKSVPHIMMKAGLSVRPSRAPNVWNQFRSWYATKYASEMKDLTPKQRTARASAAFGERMMGLAEGDIEGKKERMQDVYADLEEWRGQQKNPSVSRESSARRIKTATNQFTELGNSWSTLEDIVIGGFVAYIGHDPQSKALSTFWSGSDFVRRLIELYGTRLDALMDIIITSCKAMKYNDEGIEMAIPGPSGTSSNHTTHQDPTAAAEERDDSDRDDDDDRAAKSTNERPLIKVPKPLGERDGLRKELATRLLADLVRACPALKTSQTYFPWRNWLEYAFKYHVRVVNWPILVKPPGPGFSLKTLSLKQLQYMKNAGVTVQQWTAAEVCNALDVVEGASQISLVTATSGGALWTLGSCKSWKGYCGDKSGGKKRKHDFNDSNAPTAGRSTSHTHTKPALRKRRKVDNANAPSGSRSHKHHRPSPSPSPSSSSAACSDDESRSSDVQETTGPLPKDLAKSLEVLAAFKPELFKKINLSLASDRSHPQGGSSKAKSQRPQGSHHPQPHAGPSKLQSRQAEKSRSRGEEMHRELKRLKKRLPTPSESE